MSDLEQRIKEAAEKADDDDAEPSEIEAWYEIASPFNIKALLAEKDAEIEQLKWAARVNSDEWKQRVESLKVEITELRTRLGKPRCIDCNEVRMINCSHFDECGGRWVYALEDERNQLKDRAELADLIIKTWMELQYIEASDARKRKLKIDTIEYFGGGFLETGGAYDALSGPREGEQDATVPKTVSSA